MKRTNKFLKSYKITNHQIKEIYFHLLIQSLISHMQDLEPNKVHQYKDYSLIRQVHNNY
jgi:hypothetical protein